MRKALDILVIKHVNHRYIVVKINRKFCTRLAEYMHLLHSYLFIHSFIHLFC